jgi:hypothetical protein
MPYFPHHPDGLSGEMPPSDQTLTFPPLLAELHKLDFDYADGDGIDFESYSEFMDAEETLDWFRAWTGNPAADGSCFRVFGQDGTGGYAALWLAHSGKPLLEQPIVFLGSEGETGVVAPDFESYLWLLAFRKGPYEAVAYPAAEDKPNELFTSFVMLHSTAPRSGSQEILDQARRAHPGFPDWIQSQCR